ncbi:MAG TPA: MMPL family transporter [Micromonosporaceae bacterium]|nr:MMPL family transporter [Micromonosporaceae bacterium]
MPEGVLARIARWCFRRRWWVLAAWLCIATAGALASEPVFNALVSGSHPKHAESVQATDQLDAAAGSSGDVVGLVDRVDPRAPAVRDAVDRAVRDIEARSDVRSASGPYSPGLPPERAAGYLSADGQALLVVATLDSLSQRDRLTTVRAVSDRMHRLADELRSGGQPAARVRVGGELAVEQQAIDAEEKDLGLGEELSLPITLVVLVIVFGGLVAAGTPVLAAVVSVATAMVLLLGASRLTALDSNVVTVVTVLGLALSIDYSLLLVARYRDELLDGAAPDDAVGRAWATAGRTIAFSALTMAAALSGLLMFDLPLPFALGVAGISIAVVAMLVALTFTAAVIGIARRRIRPSRRAIRRHAAAGGTAEAGFFFRLSGLVQRRPALIAVVTAALLLLAGSPLLSSTFKRSGLGQLPPGMESVQVAGELASRFGHASASAVTVVARTDPATLDSWAARWGGDPAVARVQPAEAAGAGISVVKLDVTGDPQGASAKDLVHRVRADRPPAAQSWVTGDAAVLVDLLALIRSGLPWAIGLTLLAMTVLLFAMTGSVVVPVKAALANAVSLGATFGVMSAVFEHGFLAGPLHTRTLGGLDPFMMVIIFAFAFGLSVDYEVFLLARIKEYVDRGMDTNTAVRRGLQHTGRIITSAALVVVIVLACFGGAQTGEIEQLGIGLSVAVFVDATVVRCLLVPTTMTLLGRWVWWAPAWLQRLRTRVGRGEHPLTPAVIGH